MAEKNNRPQISVTVNKDSFKKSKPVTDALAVLQKDLDEILKKNPLVANIDVKVGSTFQTTIDKLKEDIKTVTAGGAEHDIKFKASSSNFSSFTEAVKKRLAAIQESAHIEIILDPTQVSNLVKNISDEMNRQFKELGGGQRALADFEQAMSHISAASDEARDAIGRVVKAEQSIEENATASGRGINTIANALKNLETNLQGYMDEKNFDSLALGAERAKEIIDKLADKLKKEDISLVGTLDVDKTASKVAGSMPDVASRLIREYPEAKILLTGDLNEYKTASQIANTIRNSLEYQLQQRGAYVSLDYNGLVASSGDSRRDVIDYKRELGELKAQFQELKRYSFDEIVNKWNEQLNKVSFNGVITPLQNLKNTLDEVASKFEIVEGIVNSSKLFVEKAQTTASKGKKSSNTVTTTLSKEMAPIQIGTVVDIDQVKAAVNLALGQIDQSSYNKIPVGVEIVGLVEAINQAITGLQGNNATPTNLPIAFDATGLKAAINAEISSLNSKPGTLEKIKLEFDTSDLTRVVDEGTKAIEAIKAATAAAAASGNGGSGGTGGGGKRTPSADSIEMARFKIQQEVDAAKKLKKQFSNEGLAAMGGQKIDVSAYDALTKSIKSVEAALRKAAKATTDKDKAEILNSSTMKKAVIQLKQYEKETKALYKANSNFFNNSFDQNAIKKAFSTYQKALETAQKWGGTGFHYSKAGNIVGDADKNHPLGRVKPDGTTTSSDRELYRSVGAQLEAQAQLVKQTLDDIQAKWKDTSTPKKKIADLNRQLEVQIQELLRIKNIADTLEEVKFGDISNPDFIQNYSVAFQKLQNQFAAFEGYQSDPQFADLKIDVGTYADKLAKAYEKFQQLKNGMGTLSGEEAQNLAHEIATSVAELDEFVVKTKAARAGIAAQTKEQNKVQQEQARINDYAEKYERRLKRFPALWADIKKIQDAAANGMDSEALKRSIDTVMMNARDLGVETENIFTKIWERVGFNFRSMVASQGMMLLMSSFRDLYNNVKELDAAMTELKKVTDGTANTYIRFLDNASERAQKLGASLVDVVSSTADFARLGYGLEDASTLSDAATIYLNVGDDVNSIDDATKSIISTMQGFGIEAKNVMTIVDKFNEVKDYCLPA